MGEAVDGPRGRPRDESRDQAIREAVVEILSKEGYHDLTIDAVAARAHVGKATVYRRWPGKSELVIDTISSLSQRERPMPDTGSLREDLLSVLNGWRKTLTGRLGGIVVAVIAELPRNPELAGVYQVETLQSARNVMQAVLHRAAERGEIPEDAPFSLASELAGGVMIYRLIFQRAPLSEEFVNALVDEALLPMLCTGRTTPVSTQQPAETEAAPERA